MLSDWLAQLAPIFQPMRNKTNQIDDDDDHYNYHSHYYSNYHYYYFNNRRNNKLKLIFLSTTS